MATSTVETKVRPSKTLENPPTDEAGLCSVEPETNS